MSIGQLGGLLDIGDQVFPRGGEALIRLRFRTALHKGFHHPRGGHLLAAAIEDLLLKLSQQGIRLVAELDRELRHTDSNVYLRGST